MNSDIEKLITPLKKHAQEYLRQWAKNGETSVGKRIGHVAASLESMALDLEDREESDLAQQVRSTAHLLEDLSDKIQSGEPEEFWHFIEEQSLHNPIAAFLVSMAAGFASGRVVRQMVSHEDQHQEEVTSSKDDFVDPEFSTAEDVVSGMEHESMVGTSAPSVGAAIPSQKNGEQGGDQWQR